jgi:two-component system chemotaxis response regulator CheY
MMRRLTSDLLHHFNKPLPQDVYNKHGQLLVKAGKILDDEDTYREMLDFGYIEGETPEVDKTQIGSDPRQLLADMGVLIADDTPLLLDMLEKSLRNLGFTRIIRVSDGEMALSKTGQYRPDLVFLDIDMPRRDGLSTLKELREEFPHLFVCMLSAHSSVGNVRAALTAGASGFLVKPFQQVRLEGVIDQFLQKHTEQQP